MKTYSESYMGQWWRKAVLSHFGRCCAVCGACEASGELECHHVVKRSRVLTRWDWKNGVALCHECHRKLHDGNLGMRSEISLMMEYDYLDYFNGYTSKDYFIETGLTRADWYQMQLEENKKKAGEV